MILMVTLMMMMIASRVVGFPFLFFYPLNRQTAQETLTPDNLMKRDMHVGT